LVFEDPKDIEEKLFPFYKTLYDSFDTNDVFINFMEDISEDENSMLVRYPSNDEIKRLSLLSTLIMLLLLIALETLSSMVVETLWTLMLVML